MPAVLVITRLNVQYARKQQLYDVVGDEISTSDFISRILTDNVNCIHTKKSFHLNQLKSAR